MTEWYNLENWKCVFHVVWDLYDVLRDLVPFVQFKKHEKQPLMRATFSKVADFSLKVFSLFLLKVKLFHGCFSRLLNCTNSTKSRNAPHICMYFWWNHVYSFHICSPPENVKKTRAFVAFFRIFGILAVHSFEHEATTILVHVTVQMIEKNS